MKNFKNSKGFTLIELLVVIAIIGILASFVFVSVASARKKAKDAQVKNAISQIKNQAAIFVDDNNTYDGLAAEEEVVKLVAEADDANSSGSVVWGVTNADGYVIGAQLVSDDTKWFCLDSEGTSKEVATAIVADTTVTCP
jgi:prepilin-type N-terminal cleavage/methylation domain-containing protein